MWIYTPGEADGSGGRLGRARSTPGVWVTGERDRRGVELTTRIQAFAECFLSDTRQRRPALGKELVYQVWDTRHIETLGKDCFGKDSVSVTRRRNGCFSLPSAREKMLGKEGFADALYAEPSLASATLGKVFAECF
jgi:hypothetical protein